MLLEFGARNFFNFREGFQISFRLNKNCPQEISQGKNVANVLCLKGANGSGKTNVIKALSFISYFSAHSFNEKPDKEIPFSPFFDNDDKEPTSFYIEFAIDNEEYRYAFDLFKNHVALEELIKIKTKETLFKRINGDSLETAKEYEDLKKIKIRKNASIVSIANQYDISTIAPVYNFLKLFRCNVGQSGLLEIPPFNEQNLLWYYFVNPDKFEFVKNILKECDLGIDDIQIKKNENTSTENIYDVKFIHKVKNEIKKKLPLAYQSSGTKTLFQILVEYKNTLDHQSVLALDEFDNKLHPDILPKLVSLFENPESNPHNSQFIFSTHNEKIMDQLGKYRTVLVNKKENESFLYRLDEIGGELLRNDRKITPIYESGVIGGVPRL